MAPRAIDVEELRSEVNKLFDLFAAKGVRTVEIDTDNYWAFPWDEVYVATAAPPGAAIGSLSDDLEFLRDGSNGPVALMLCQAAPLLHFLGQRANAYGVF